MPQQPLPPAAPGAASADARPRPRHFSLVRSFTPADFVTLLNAV
ncbi:MAG: hypothetical protein RL685_5899, partial [Pseudomonadota bacterium]